jgi:SecD/SecF fusion protein
MTSSLRWRGLFLAALTGLAIWAAVPPKEKINLGLDLRGGMHLVLRVQTLDALKAETDKDMDGLRRAAEAEGVLGLRTEKTGDTSFAIVGVPASKEADFEKVQNDLFQGALGQSARWTMSKSGDRYTFEMTERNKNDIREQSVNQAVQTIRNRVDEFGVAEPVITRETGSDRVVVQLPGVEDPERVRDLIKRTAFLEFRLVHAGSQGPADSREALVAQFGGALPGDAEVFPQDLRDPEGRSTGQVFWALERQRVITGRDLKMANASQDQLGSPAVGFNLSVEGSRQFGRVTGESIGRLLAIVLDGKVQSAPRINDRITDSGIITGSFTVQEVQDLVTTLKSGALPAGIEYLEERTVGASLGADSIRKGLRAGLVSTVLTVLAMFLVYSLTGINAVAALTLNAILIFGGLCGLHATLTLPGIAGIVLSVAMAFDANVLVFERIREELKIGRSVRASIEAGFSKALSAIVDSNITTVVAALFLFQFGTGPVRGFAVTLVIGIIGTMIASVVFSRWLFDGYSERRKRTDNKMAIWGISFPETNFNFMKYRKVWVGISLAVIVVGLAAIFVHGKLNFGIDFTGGTQLTVKFPSSPPVDEIRSTLASSGLAEASIQRIGTQAENEILVRTPIREGSEEGTAPQLIQALKAKYPGIEVRSTENVGPQVGSELRKKGLLAVLFSMIGMLIYIWIRFELRFGVGALMAVVHDVLVTVGLFAIFGFEFNLTTVAAFLTLVGYSVNDTVVVFDRVRENMRKSRVKPLIETLNESLNQTLSRTILTGGTTLAACICLMAMGGEVLRGFAFILFVGVIVGTYSSIYIAAPFALLWEERFGKAARAERANLSVAKKAV